MIEATIEAVLAQSARPVRWVIVSDGSTDGTDEIVRGLGGGRVRLIRQDPRGGKTDSYYACGFVDYPDESKFAGHSVK